MNRTELYAMLAADYARERAEKKTEAADSEAVSARRSGIYADMIADFLGARIERRENERRSAKMRFDLARESALAIVSARTAAELA